MAFDLFARQWGQGPPVLFVHGLGASSRYWEPLGEASSGYAGVAPDLLGFGHSPTPPHVLRRGLSPRGGEPRLSPGHAPARRGGRCLARAGGVRTAMGAEVGGSLAL